MGWWRGFLDYYLRSGLVAGLLLALLAGLLTPGIPLIAVIVGSLTVFVLTVLAGMFRFRRLVVQEMREESADREWAAARVAVGFDGAGVDARGLRFGVCGSGLHVGLWVIVQAGDLESWRYLVPGPGWGPVEAEWGQGVSRSELGELMDAWDVRFLSESDLGRSSDVVARYRAELLYRGFVLNGMGVEPRRRRSR